MCAIHFGTRWRRINLYIYFFSEIQKNNFTQIMKLISFKQHRMYIVVDFTHPR